MEPTQTGCHRRTCCGDPGPHNRSPGTLDPWIPGTRPGMTVEDWARPVSLICDSGSGLRLSADDALEIEPQIFQDDLRRVAPRAAGDAAAGVGARARHIEAVHRRFVLPVARHRPVAAELPGIGAEMQNIRADERGVVTFDIKRRHEGGAEDVAAVHI